MFSKIPLHHGGIIAASTWISTNLLFLLDHETQGIADLFQPGMCLVSLLYCIPTILFCGLIYLILNRYFPPRTCLWYALLGGIPSGFLLVIFFLLL